MFGPVITTHEFSTEEELVERANDTKYGLFAAVWTSDIDCAHQIAHAVDADSIAVNEYPALFPQSPFGGYKKSGLGREKEFQVIDIFTKLKNVAMSLGETEGGSFEG